MDRPSQTRRREQVETIELCVSGAKRIVRRMFSERAVPKYSLIHTPQQSE